MDEEEYDHEFGVREIISFDKEWIYRQTKDYPKKVVDTSYKDISNTRMIGNAITNNIVLVRVHDIKEQLYDFQDSDEKLDGAMHISLSRESSDIFSADQIFINKLQQLKKVTNQ